jgi:DNA/RNA-binding domain of Phe-tRNA-synthetase-like protein
LPPDSCTLLFLYSMTTVSIDPFLKTKCPRIALGCLTADVEASETSAALEKELGGCEQKILLLPEPRAAVECPAILATRSGYKALGKDPARYRGSAEALIRRVIAGKGLPRIHAVVDIINIASVESRLPIGLYDLAHVRGNITFRAGRAGETYKGIGKYDLNLEGLPLFADELGPHGSATSDSERTMVTPSTKQVLAIFVSFGGPENLDRFLERMSLLLAAHASGKNFAFVVI